MNQTLKVYILLLSRKKLHLIHFKKYYIDAASVAPSSGSTNQAYKVCLKLNSKFFSQRLVTFTKIYIFFF